ncbi:MAG TPA: type II toxin-antitoxin system VapC family toxin [Candidatus Acidoferrales bacterium]|nr:type II toxin-antitoxin system VapC family toxin [Candidatus Acidoferrales bacterium]
MPDVNVLVYAHREETANHQRYAEWLKKVATGPEPFALSEPVLQGFLRVVTNPRIFQPPSTVERAFLFLDALITRPGCTMIRPGAQHWPIFRMLCEKGELKGKLLRDAAHAALAIESGCEWVSADTDFARFAPPLRWTHL